jgi:hypothetical protein
VFERRELEKKRKRMSVYVQEKRFLLIKINTCLYINRAVVVEQK